jgi:flagellar protein FlaF
MSIQSQLKTYQPTPAQQSEAQEVSQGGQRGNPRGYQKIPRAGSPTYTEAWALIEAARRMAAAIQSGPVDDIETKRVLRDTIRLNWRLWTIFQAELTTGNTQLPEDIQTNMLNLCQFVDKHTVDTIADTTVEKVVTLIDLNRNIAAGLLESLQKANDDGEAAAPNPAPANRDETTGAEQPIPDMPPEGMQPGLIDQEV